MKRLLLTCTDLMAIQFMVPHIKYLSENGFSVKLACSVVGDRLSDLKEALDGVAEIETVRLVRSPLAVSNLNGLKDLKRIINREKWDVIWTNEPVMGIMTRLAAKNARKRGTKVVYMVHGFHFYKGAPLLNRVMFYPIEKYCSRLCDMIVTINKEDYERAKTFHSKRVEKINGIGVNLEKFAPNENAALKKRCELGLNDGDIMILNVGELTKRKNQHVIIGALKILNDKKFKLFICGRGDSEDELKAMVKSFGLLNQVSFLGYRPDINDLCSASDMFVFTSLQEGLPRAVMEAMANGKPVVCSNIRGNVDLIDEKGGFVVPNNAEAVAKAVRTLAENELLRKAMGACNMAKAELFSEEKAQNAVLTLLNSLVE